MNRSRSKTSRDRVGDVDRSSGLDCSESLADAAARLNLSTSVLARLQRLCAEFSAVPDEDRGQRGRAVQRDTMREIEAVAVQLRDLLSELPNHEFLRKV